PESAVLPLDDLPAGDFHFNIWELAATDWALRPMPPAIERRIQDLTSQPYMYGKMVCMKKTFNIDEKLFEEAKASCGAATDTDTVRMGLEALIRHAAYRRLAALSGSDPAAADVPRRREPPRRKRKSA
ncbi:MAG TPA: type II toxin-antitoxin system VapB family antitoxin, partial [Bryobacteraceae bacterium]|nr:type II toxin-antitoxin system VapB family antitoxin [Bryobacteraceae bacterium]